MSSAAAPTDDNLELEAAGAAPAAPAAPAATAAAPLNIQVQTTPAPSTPITHLQGREWVATTPNSGTNTPLSPRSPQVPSPRVSLSIAERPERPPKRDRVSNSQHGSTEALSRGPSTRRSHSIHRGQARGRTSTDSAGGAIRRSLSIIRRSDVSGPIDPMQEPRRSIGKRPSEYGLKEKDPHQGKGKEWWKHVRRAVPFGAPYARSGVVIDQPAQPRDFIVPGPLTFGHGQWWYLVFGQGIVAAVISAAINFGVAVALYRTQPTIDIWTFKRQTVAGDMGVTVIIQQIVSFIITSALVHHDLYAGPIGPLRKPWPPLLHLPSTPDPAGHKFGTKMPEDVDADGHACPMGRSQGKSKWNGYWWWFVRAVCTGSERNDLLASGISWRQRLERLVWTAAQGFFLCVLTFWWYWPLAIAIVAPIYGGRELAGTWIPMFIKLLFGGILALITNPIMALMAMGAESSVRRCYPELPIWYPFGGQADFEQWKAEQGIASGEEDEDQASFESPRELEQSATHTRKSSATQTQQQQVQFGAEQRPRDKAPQMLGSIPMGRRITEEPGNLLLTDDESEPPTPNPQQESTHSRSRTD